MTRLPVLRRQLRGRALCVLAASLIITACSTSSSTQSTDDGGVLPDGGDSPDVSTTPDGGTPDGAPVIESFSPDPLGLPTNGGMVTLSWEVSGANTLSIDQGVGDVSGDSTTVEVTETTRFTLTATNDEGSVTRATSVFTSTGEPPPFPRTGVPTSVDAIEAALESGTIDDVTALRYKVFALFGDPRLPEEFEAEGLIHGSAILEELAVRFEQLDPAVQTELRPFTLPPDDPESAYQSLARKHSVSPKGGAYFWDSVEVATGKIEVWWESTVSPAERDLVEQVLAPAIEGAYNLLVDTLKMRPPISYEPWGGLPYNVYVVDWGSAGAYGWNQPYTFDDALGGRPSYVVVNLGVTGSAASDMAKATAAHELMHGMQNAYKTKDSVTSQSVRWLKESTATWVEDYVYQYFNTEHEYVKSFTSTPELSLDDISDDRHYGAYLFFIFVDRQPKFEDDKIREIWETVENVGVLTAVDQALGGELADEWPRFTAYNWNNDAPTLGSVTYHALWDGLSNGPNGVFWFTPQEGPSIAGRQEVVEMDAVESGVDYLSAHYYYYDLTDPGLHNVVLANGFTFDLQEGSPELFPTDVTLYATKLPEEDRKGASVQVLVKANGKWFPDAFDITDVAFVPFCQDYMEERIEELVVIFSNGRWRDGDRDPIEPQGLTPRLFLSNVSCGDWVGEGSAFTAYDDGEDSEISTVNLENLLFTRDRIPHESLLGGAGSFDFLGTIAPRDATPLAVARYRAEIVDVSWSTDIRSITGNDECIALGTGEMTVADADPALFDIRPSFVGPTAHPASAYRSFYMTLVFRAPGLPVTETCTESGTANLPFGTGIAGGLRNTDLGLLEVSPDGLSINESWEVDDTTYYLDLLGFPDP